MQSTIRSILKIILFLFGCAVSLSLCRLFSLVVVSRGQSVASVLMLLIVGTSPVVEPGL